MPVQFLLRSEGLPATIAFHLTGLLPFLILPLICHENHLPSLNLRTIRLVSVTGKA